MKIMNARTFILFSGNQNQPAAQSGFHQHSPQEVKTVRQRVSILYMFCKSIYIFLYTIDSL